jgi:hydrogenase nickel incorporation protein HypB
MCANCGCQGDKAQMLDLQTGEMTTLHAADHEHSHSHDHSHPHEHSHPPGHAHDQARDGAVNIIDVETRILAKNDAAAEKNRAWFAGREILALNFVSSPGAGKTTLLERTIADRAGDPPLFVIEGDQATANDSERIRKAGAAVVQINTDTGCHLDAQMVTRALSALKPSPGALLFIENVGNLVCPALFDLGERAKVVIFSITDGEDKPLKYPHMFRAAAIVLLSKIDLLPHLDFSLDEAIMNVRKANPEAAICKISARTGEGLADWYDWLRREAALAHQQAFA